MDIAATVVILASASWIGSIMARAGSRRAVAGDKSASTADAVRDQILQAAAAAFMQQGYAATSIDAIAEVVGSTKGLIYYYFKSKADLFFEVHREAMDRNLTCIRPIAARDDMTCPAKLREMLIQHALLIMNNFPSQRVTVLGVEMHLTASTTPRQRETLETLMGMRDEYETMFLDVLRRGVEAGEFTQLEPSLAAKMLLGALNWMTIWYRPRAADRDATKRALAERMVDLQIAGIMAA